jgi:hypothetical protein
MEQNPNNPLSFEEWKRSGLTPSMSDELMKSMQRLHNVSYMEEYETMLKNEYQEYLSDFNGNWLL